MLIDNAYNLSCYNYWENNNNFFFNFRWKNITENSETYVLWILCKIYRTFWKQYLVTVAKVV